MFQATSQLPPHLEIAVGSGLRILPPLPWPPYRCERLHHTLSAAADVQDVEDVQLLAQQLHSVGVCSRQRKYRARQGQAGAGKGRQGQVRAGGAMQGQAGIGKGRPGKVGAGKGMRVQAGRGMRVLAGRGRQG